MDPSCSATGMNAESSTALMSLKKYSQNARKKSQQLISNKEIRKSRYSAQSPKSIYLSSVQTNSNCFGVIAKFRLQNMVKKKAADVSVYPFLKN